MVPKGWKSVYLNDISEKIMVGIASAATHAYCDDGIRMLRNLNIKDGWIDDSDILFVNEEYEKQHKNKRLKTGDILTVRTGYPGVSAVVPEKYNNAQCFTSLITRLNTSNALPAYICRFINSEYGKKYITSGEAGGAQKNVNAAILKKMRIPLPPLLEQQKIGNILSTWDKAISTTERLIDNSTQQKSALMQQLLTGKQRLLDESGQRFAGEWEEYKLGEITDFIRDGTHGTHKRYESGVPMLSAKNITKENTVDFDDAPYISEEDYNKIHARYTIKSGDILLTVVGTLGRVALVPEELAEKFTLQRSVAIIRVAKGVCNQFLMQLFSSSDFTHLLHRKSNSTAQAGVYLGELGKLKILLPSFEEQQKIATVLTNADKEIELLEQQLADLQQEKKALMQVLLTGKRRVMIDGEVA
ncbi:restriction endonuclease subunit S [Psychrobacter faecalis]|uniref:restriction endonuclease subunit S n=1 Tax=Psychrobacter faecalis TaxID=180588 RepID=UPI003FD6BE22